MIICGSGDESEMDLCGSILPPLIYNSSLTITSSPSTDTPSIRTYKNKKKRISYHVFESESLVFLLSRKQKR